MLCRPAGARALWCAGAALLCTVAAVPAALAAGTASFSIRPGHFDANDPATRAYFKRALAVGASFSDTVVVANGGTMPVTLLVYPVDGLTGRTSGSVYANRDQPRRKAGAWLRVGTARVTVQPGTETAIPFTAIVPSTATPGDHLAGIAFEDAQVSTSTGRFQVRQVLREVIGVLIRVDGPARPRLLLGRMSLRTLPGTKLGAVLVRIGNSGRLLCKPFLSVALSARTVHERVDRQLDTILPGDTIAYPLVLRHGLRPSRYALSARASCPQTTASAEQRFVLGSALTGSADRNAANPTVVRASSGVAPLTVAAIAAATALAGAGAGWLVRLRRSRT